MIINTFYIMRLVLTFLLMYDYVYIGIVKHRKNSVWKLLSGHHLRKLVINYMQRFFNSMAINIEIFIHRQIADVIEVNYMHIIKQIK